MHLEESNIDIKVFEDCSAAALWYLSYLKQLEGDGEETGQVEIRTNLV